MQAKIAMAQAKAMRPWYKKKRWWLAGFLLLFVALIIIVVASAANTVSTLNSQKQQVVYEISGHGRADVGYSTEHDGNFGQSEDTNAALPWKKSVTVSGLLRAYTLVGQLTGGGSTISCSIYVNGKLATSNSSTGQFASVTCSTSG